MFVTFPKKAANIYHSLLLKIMIRIFQSCDYKDYPGDICAKTCSLI